MPRTRTSSRKRATPAATPAAARDVAPSSSGSGSGSSEPPETSSGSASESGDETAAAFDARTLALGDDDAADAAADGDAADGDAADGDADEPLTAAEQALRDNVLAADPLDPRIRYLREEPAPPQFPADAEFYESESSEELDGDANTVGNVPMEWYRHYDHIGYNVFGQKLLRSDEADRLDRFLSRADDPAYWRTVRDELNARDVTLSERELDMIRAMQRNRYPTGFDPYEQPPEIDDPALKVHGMTQPPVPKSRFVPSKWERLKVRRLVLALRRGDIREESDDDSDPDKLKRPRYYDLWSKDAQRHAPHLQLKAPRMRLPGHAESYRPPEEYLFSKAERRKWEELDEEDRHISFVPQRLDRMRELKLFEQGMRERFDRQLDLYLAPRTVRKRTYIPPDELLPKLPKPEDLRPFPMNNGVEYVGHTDRVRSLSVHATGRWLATASDDGTVRVWEVLTSRCLKVLTLGDVVTQCAWCPNADVTLLAVICDEQLLFVNAGVGNARQHSATELMLTLPDEPAPNSAEAVAKKMRESKAPDGAGKVAQWLAIDAAVAGRGDALGDDAGAVRACEGARIRVPHPNPIKQVVWHRKGDYLATVAPESGTRTVMVHQMSTARTQAPFRRNHGGVEVVSFHPTKPHFVVASKTHVRVYNLVRQKLHKKLVTQAKFVSSVDVHPRGENIIVSTFDRRLVWFDLELSARPYKTLRYHSQAIRRARFHARHPLFASAADDGTVHIFHGMAYDDWSQNALIVPLKVLRGHKVSGDGLGVLDIEFHPIQPWVFSAGADHKVILWS